MPALLVCVLMLALSAVQVHAQGAAPQAAAGTEADDKEARDLFQIGKDAFDEGRFERALKYFRDAYELSHRAALLSNIGTVLDRLRRDGEALDAYRSYLEQVPEAANRRQVEERIRIIESALARSQPAPPAPAAVVPTPPPGAANTHAQEPLVPTPAQTARAADMQSDARHPTDTGPAPITSRWWFWTGIGAVAVAAVVVVVAVSAAGSSNTPDRPTLLDPTTKVREL
jgi:tetratricopeptide (TPR) repeat protein